MLDAAFALAAEISSKSPVAVQGTKINLVYSRDHSVAEALNYMVRVSLPPADQSRPLSRAQGSQSGISGILARSADGCTANPLRIPLPRVQASWNMSMLQTQDIPKSVQAMMEKKDLKSVTFSKL